MTTEESVLHIWRDTDDVSYMWGSRKKTMGREEGESPLERKRTKWESQNAGGLILLPLLPLPLGHSIALSW